MRFPPLLPLGMLVAVVFAGAGAAYLKGRSATSARGTFSVAKSPGGFPRTFTAPDGTTLVLSAPPRRVIALALSAEEIILELSGPEIFAAVTEKARDPFISHIWEDVREVLQQVSGTTVERMVRLRPDLVLVMSFTDRRARTFLERCKVPVFPLPDPDSLESIRETVRILGHLLGREERASRMLSEIDARLEAVKNRIAAGPPPKVLYLSGGFWTAGSRTVIDEIIRLSGCVNVAAEKGVNHFLKVKKETLILWNPQWLLLEGEEDTRDEIIEQLSRDPALAPLSAVRAARVVVIPSSTLTSISHHALDAVERLLTEIHEGGLPR